MFIHQGVGRLRQRGSVEFVVDIPSNLDLDNLSPSIFSEKMVTKWLLDKSCRVRRFNQLFSGVNTSPCKICDVCIRSSASMNRIEILSQEGDRARVVDLGKSFYNQLKSQCGYCKDLQCKKMCDKRRCYKCGIG